MSPHGDLAYHMRVCISPQIGCWWCRFNKLAMLELYSNRLNGSLPDEWQTMQPDYIDLHNNTLQACLLHSSLQHVWTRNKNYLKHAPGSQCMPGRWAVDEFLIDCVAAAHLAGLHRGQERGRHTYQRSDLCAHNTC